MCLTKAGDVLIVPTPGHTPHYMSVVVRGSPSLFIAGDTSYNQQMLLDGKVDGVSPSVGIAKATNAKIAALAKEQPLVYLPSQDPESPERLSDRSVLTVE